MLTTERLKELLDYDPLTGIFRWRVDRKGAIRRGKVAGGPDQKGHMSIAIDGVRYMAHRVAWFYMTGSWPIGEIDHEDLNGENNRFENLRDSKTRTFQRANQRVRQDSSSGVKGVKSTPAGTWKARIRFHGKEYYLGTFPDIAEAHAAYIAKAREFFGEFARAA